MENHSPEKAGKQNPVLDSGGRAKKSHTPESKNAFVLP
jgi:hypothetical protein